MSATETESVLVGALTAVVAGAEEDDDRTSTAILDASFELFCHIGIPRTTMEDVARRAGVSRITVYRRFANKGVLVDQVVRREIRRYIDRFRGDIEQARTAADRVVVGFVSSLHAIRHNPLIRGLMAADPNALIPTTIGDNGRTFATVRAFVAGQLRREQEAGHVSAAVDADLVAEMMVRVCASFLLIPSQVVDLDDEQQLADLARRFLVPMLGAPPAPDPAPPAPEPPGPDA
jgi:TetR/AcrR family transcriptional regulator, repressor for uid operon